MIGPVWSVNPVGSEFVRTESLRSDDLARGWAMTCPESANGCKGRGRGDFRKRLVPGHYRDPNSCVCCLQNLIFPKRMRLRWLNHPRLNHQMQITSGVLAARCGELLQSFFVEKRKV